MIPADNSLFDLLNKDITTHFVKISLFLEIMGQYSSHFLSQ